MKINTFASLKKQLVILSNRRRTEPFGLKGGKSGKKGKNLILRSDNTKLILKYADEVNVKKDDSLVLMTPGGGGYGK